MNLLIDKDEAVAILRERIKEIESFEFKPEIWKFKTKLDVARIYGPLSTNALEVAELKFRPSLYIGELEAWELRAKINAKSLLEKFIDFIEERDSSKAKNEKANRRIETKDRKKESGASTRFYKQELMKERKLQVFVSSTYTDLIDERQAAVKAILSSGNIPAGMELFSAGDESQMIVIKRWIDESDVYLLILGGRYGSIDKTSGKSYTQLEYEYAVSTNKAHFAVVINESALDKKIKLLGLAAVEENQKELKIFRSEVLNGRIVNFWDDIKDIKFSIQQTLSEFSNRKELVGWVRGNNSQNAKTISIEIEKLTKQNSELKEKISTFQQQHLA